MTTKKEYTDRPDVYTRYEQAYRDRQGNEQEFTDALTALSKFFVYSVIKKLNTAYKPVTDTTPTAQANNDAMRYVNDLKRSMTVDLKTLDKLKSETDKATVLEYTADGDAVKRVIDKTADEHAKRLLREPLSDGLDLFQEASMLILSETDKALLRDKNNIDKPFLELPYTVTALRRKVRIKDEDNQNLYKEVTTTPAQEVFRGVRRLIANSKAVRTLNTSYTYLEQVIGDDEDVVYKRLPKYSTLGTTPAFDTNGVQVALTADADLLDKAEKILTALNLTAKQAQVLKLRARGDACGGYGYKAIAKYLGVTPRAVAKTIKKIQEKAVAIGLTTQDKINRYEKTLESLNRELDCLTVKISELERELDCLTVKARALERDAKKARELAQVQDERKSLKNDLENKRDGKIYLQKRIGSLTRLLV